MNLIKSVIFIGCVMGIISTFADIAAPEGSLKKQLNLILGIVLVLTVITPFLGNEFKISLRDYSSAAQTEQFDLSGYADNAVLDTANQKIKEYFLDKLNKNDISLQELNIYSELNEYNEIEIRQVDVFLNNSAGSERARQLVLEDLPETEVNIKEGEDADRKN